jgi:CubicO group peptidase (beta-lactamase class C family)
VRALELITTWPVPNVSAAVIDLTVDHGARVHRAGDPTTRYRIASISKPITAWACLIAVEEGLLELESPIGQPGCTLAHLLSHAGGYAFDGDEPVADPGRRRIYSNTGIDVAATAVAAAAAMPFEQYLREAVFEPLGMRDTVLRGSPAHAIWSTVDDLVGFLLEVLRPTLLSETTAAQATQPVFSDLAGIVPGIGRFDPCPWGLGFEVHGAKHPHWMGDHNSPAAFGHFGGAGTMCWIDREAVPGVELAVVSLTDRPFDEWSIEAMRRWPELSDAVIAETAATARTSAP